MSRNARASTVLLVSCLFLVSGATGLLYEVAFSKVLATIFGATAYAVSTVLSAFMAGLALGAHFGGRISPRIRRPLVAYGIAEILVGAIAAGTPLVFDVISQAYVGIASANADRLGLLTVVRLGLTFTAILIPTSCMGATLPMLAKVVAGSDESASRLPRLYAVNTLGGAVGSLASAYAILPWLGIRGTMRAAAVANVIIGVLAIVRGLGLGAEEEKSTTVESSAAEPPEKLANNLLFYAALSGFLVFAAEVVQTHLLTLLIGNSAYAFGLMLAVFLVCLGLGAARSAGFAEKHGHGALARGLVYSAISLVITLQLWDQLPGFFAFCGKHVGSWAGREVCRAIAALVILVLPTYWMGTTFPLLLRRVASRASVSRDVGVLTVANTFGTIVGSLLTGYVILPLLGSQRSLDAIAVAFAALGVYAAVTNRGDLFSKRLPTRQIALGLGLVTVILALALPRWNLTRLTNGANVYFTYGKPPESIDFVREDVHGGVTTVALSDGLHTLYTNGKFQGDDGKEMTAQRRFAHYPSLFIGHEGRALVIGLGTGTTLGTIAAYPFEHIDVAEISPAIVEASRLFFRVPSRSALDDQRVKLSLNDGRNVLLTATEPIDLITIELTSVWFAGASNLYSEEFYRLAKAHLSTDGVLQQWVQLHHIRPREVAAIVRTLRKVFKHVALFEGGAQGILVASDNPLVASRARLERLEALPDIQDTLEPGKHLSQLVDEMLASDEDLDRFIADVEKKDHEAPVSTDDNLFLEYATPKGNILDYNQSLAAMLAELRGYRTENPASRHLGP